jgi:homoserine O-acetyltransferase
MATLMWRTENFKLELGHTLPELALAYETHGRLAADGANAILVTHGFTSSHHAAGPSAPGEAPGWWDGLIGPGKAIDTGRHFVVSSNMLGSSRIDRAGEPEPSHRPALRPDFPTSRSAISWRQRALLDSLGVRRLVAVAGPSFGGYHAFQWAVTYPEYMSGVVAAVTAPKGPGNDSGVRALVERFAADPGWHGGWHYDTGGIPATMIALRMETLRRYGQNESRRTVRPRAPRRAHSRDGGGVGASVRPQLDGRPQGAVAIRRRARLRRIRAEVLYALSRTDCLPAGARARRHGHARAAGVDARYVEIDPTSVTPRAAPTGRSGRRRSRSSCPPPVRAGRSRQRRSPATRRRRVARPRGTASRGVRCEMRVLLVHPSALMYWRPIPPEPRA